MVATNTSGLPSIGNKRVKQKVEDFVKLLEDNKEKKFFICSHDNPDPDSIASAWGISRILDFMGIVDWEIVYKGEISHPQNRAMANVLNIPIRKWLPEHNKEEAVFIFVDCVPNQKNITIEATPLIIIDHHKVTPPRNIFSIHEEIGACATLVTDLMLSMAPRSNGEEDATEYICFDPDVDNMKELATALALGIKTDTIEFRSEVTSDDDMKAYRILSRFISDDKFAKIVNYELPEYMFDFEVTAWDNRTQEAPNFITGLEYVDEKSSDCIPYLADKYMRLRGIQTVVVYGCVGNTIRASVRTSSASFDCDQLCKEIFGENNAGAKHGIGGARVAYSIFDLGDMDDDDKKKIWEVTKSQIERKFKKATQE